MLSTYRQLITDNDERRIPFRIWRIVADSALLWILTTSIHRSIIDFTQIFTPILSPILYLLSVFSLLKAEWNYHKYLKSFADFAELKTSKTVGWVYILIPIDMGDADLPFSFKMINENDVKIRFLRYSTVLYSTLTYVSYWLSLQMHRI